MYSFSPLLNKPWFLHVSCTSPFKNTAGKPEIARDEQFLIFPQRFLSCENFLPFLTNLKLSSASYFSLKGSKICRFGKDQEEKRLINYIS